MCERVALPGGGFAIVCGGRGSHRQKRACVHCGQPAAFECDGPPAPIAGNKRKTCDATLCRRCRIHVPPNQDYCRAHMKEAAGAAAQLRMAFDQEQP